MRKRLFELQKNISSNSRMRHRHKSADSQIQLHQIVNATASARVKHFLCLLISSFPQSPSRAALGAASARSCALTTSHQHEFMKQLAESIHPSDAALFVLIKEMTRQVVEQIKHYSVSC